MKPRVIAISENTLLIQFEEHMNERINRAVHFLLNELNTRLADSLIDAVPAYCSIHLSINHHTSISSAVKNVKAIIRSINFDSIPLASETLGKVISIPVYYGEEVAPDLAYIAELANTSIDDVIKLHSQQPYQVYAVGFLPGFAYLGMVHSKIATPRKAQPRSRVPQGSVGIAGEQTGIYPIDSPGGWQIIGRTPTPLLSPNEDQISLIHLGDSIQFMPIERDEFIALGGQTSWD